MLVAAHALWIVLSRDYASMSNVPDVFWNAATHLGRFRYLLVPGHADVERYLQAVAVLALVGALLGIAPRLCCAVSALLLYHLAPLETAIWSNAPEARGLTLAPTALLILAASPSGDALALWPRPRRDVPERAGDYSWALLLIQVLVCEIYLFSAIGKLQRSGLGWGSAEHMRLWMLWFTQDDQMAVFTALGSWMARHLWLCGLVGVTTVAMEWLAPVMLFWRRARLVFVVLLLLWHVGVLLTLNIHVPEAWLVLVFVDWRALSGKLRRTPVTTLPA